MRQCECGSFSFPRGSEELRQPRRGQGQKHQAEKRREAQVETMLIVLDWFCPEVRALSSQGLRWCTHVSHICNQKVLITKARGPASPERHCIALQLGALAQ